MRVRVVYRFAIREVRSAVRARWFFVGAGSLALLSMAVAHLGMGDAGRWGVSAMDRTAAALLNLVLLFVPLLALPVAAASFAGEMEDGTLAYIVAQPVTRAEVFVGKLVGLIVAMGGSITAGFGATAIVVGARGGMSNATFVALVIGAIGLASVMMTIGALLSMLARNRSRATTAAIGAWIGLVFLCDFGVLAVAASNTLGPDGLFVLAVANPLQAVKTLIALVVSARLEVLGPVGVHAVQVFGRFGLAAMLCASLAAWAAFASAGALVVFRRTNLT